MRVIHVLRKPCSESTVAANVLRWGTGAVNVDASRVNTTPTDRAEMLKMSQGFAGRKWGRPEIANYGYEGSMPTKTVSVPSEGGRWPANLVLQHLDGCRQEGTFRVKSSDRPGHGHEHSPVVIFGPNRRHSEIRHGDEDGLETVAAWSCDPGCPVAALDDQGGLRRSSGLYPSVSQGTGQGVTYGGKRPQGQLYGDTGGASRFFKQFGGGSEP